MVVFFPCPVLLLLHLMLTVLLCQFCVATVMKCDTPSQPGSKFYRNCTVKYTDTLVLQFGNGSTSASEASWYKVEGGTSTNICDRCPTHNVTHQLSLLDSGNYSCQVPQSRSTHDSYFINITVEGPPMIQGPVFDPCKDRQHCTYPEVTFRYTSTVTLQVHYRSIGKTTVQWSLGHRSIDCESDDQTMKCKQVDTESSSTLTLLRPYSSNYSGNYRANVSNEYGWNSTKMDMYLDCNSEENPVDAVPKNISQPLPFLDSAQVQCNVPILDEADLFLCYRQRNRPLNFSSDCVTCYGNSEGLCNGTIQARPDWEVRRKRSSECNGDISAILSIPQVSLGDAGLVECYWMSAGKEFSKNSHLYMTVTVSVDKTKLWYIVTGAVVGVVLTLVVVLVIMKIVHRTYKRRYSQVHSVESTICVNEPPPATARPYIIVSTSASETRSERSAMVLSGQPVATDETTPLLIQKGRERVPYMQGENLSPTGSFMSTVSDANAQVELILDEAVPSTII